MFSLTVFACTLIAIVPAPFFRSRVMTYVIRLLIFIIQITSIFVVAWAVLRLSYAYAKDLFSTLPEQSYAIRNAYVAAILLALEILVSAGILSTVLHPSWSVLGKLAALATLRTLIKRSLTFSIRRMETKAPAS